MDGVLALGPGSDDLALSHELQKATPSIMAKKGSKTHGCNALPQKKKKLCKTTHNGNLAGVLRKSYDRLMAVKCTAEIGQK